jgi:hypothetical protein
MSEDIFLANDSDLLLTDMLYRTNNRDTRQSSEQKSRISNDLEEIGRIVALGGFRVINCVSENTVIVRRKGEDRIIPISDLIAMAKGVAIGEAAASNADGPRQAATATADAVEAVVPAHHPHAANVADLSVVPAAEAEARRSPTFHTPPVERYGFRATHWDL